MIALVLVIIRFLDLGTDKGWEKVLIFDGSISIQSRFNVVELLT